ncbi:MAG: GAK system ATP-grasp enzyme [Phycisphaerales bacterium]|nr:GAK system ATP-grasp enzyme [Phycisphaerales bacterium]
MLNVGVVGLKDGWSTQQLLHALERHGAAVRMIDIGATRLDLHARRGYCGEFDLGELDALVVKKLGESYCRELGDRLACLRMIEGFGVRVFSRPVSMRRVLDRLSCTVSLSLADVPIPPTVITECAEEAVAAVRRFGKAVLKPLYSSKARGMIVVDGADHARDAVVAFQTAGNGTIYVQKLLELPGRDLGLVFCGGRFVKCYARVGRSGSWNTTVHAGGRYEPHEPSDALIALARRAQAPFDLDFTCVDIAETADGPVVFEVSAFGGFRGLWEAWSFDAADVYAAHVIRSLSDDG